MPFACYYVIFTIFQNIWGEYVYQELNETQVQKKQLNETVLFQALDEDARDSGKNGGGTDLNLNLGLKDPDGDNEGDTAEQHEVAKNPQTQNNRFKRKSVTPDLEMRM